MFQNHIAAPYFSSSVAARKMVKKVKLSHECTLQAKYCVLCHCSHASAKWFGEEGYQHCEEGQNVIKKIGQKVVSWGSSRETVWQYESSVPNVWSSMDSKISKLHEENFQHGCPDFLYERENKRGRKFVSYDVDLKNFLQINRASERTRRLRRLQVTQEAQLQ